MARKRPTQPSPAPQAAEEEQPPARPAARRKPAAPKPAATKPAATKQPAPEEAKPAKQPRAKTPASVAAPAPPALERPSVTADRFNRLYRLVRFLAAGARPRDRILRHLRLDVRGFYRDLELLRAAGINVMLASGVYSLTTPEEETLARLPFPDPRLTLGEAQQLAKGRTSAHQSLREQIEQALP